MGLWQPTIPAATVGRPVTADVVVERPEVVAALGRALGGDVVAVCAPAGYGKTTSVVLWDLADDRPFAWARLDHLDEDPAHLLLHIATALRAQLPLDPDLLTYLGGPGREPLTQLVPALARSLEGCGPVVVVLDDCQSLADSHAVRVLSALIDDAPLSATFVLLGRGRCPVDLARRRVQRRAVELDCTTLALSTAEATELFAKVGGPQDEATVGAVVDKCEGWAAGLLMAALILRDGADAEVLTGRNRLVADYLVEEVLSQLDTGTATFLMESAVLDRFCAAHLDIVLGRAGSARRLDTVLESGSMFLIPLDDARTWYRYHRLFGELLRGRLRDLDPGRFRELASRCADLWQSDGDIDGALVQALAAGDRAHAAALVGCEAVRLGFDGRAGVLARRVGLLDEQTFREHPDAAIARAWLGVTTGDADLIQRSLLMATHADRGHPLADGTPSVDVAAALVGSLVGIGGVTEVVRHAETVRAAGDHLINPWWGAATMMKGAATAMLGESAYARKLLESALPVLGDLPGFEAAALAHLALLDLGDGDDESALRRGNEARRIADDADLSDVVPMVVVYAVSAVLAARVGDAEGARAAAVSADRLLRRLGNLAARTALLGHGLLAWTAAVTGDSEVVRRHLEAGDRARRREPEALGLCRRLDRVRLLAAGGNSRPLTPAELRLLPYLSTHMSLQGIAENLTLGRETVKSQATSIYRKLSVSSRSAAVTEARRLGLLDE